MLSTTIAAGFGLLSFFAAPEAALSASAAAQAEVSADRRAAAERYVRGPAMRDMMDQMLSPEGMAMQISMMIPEGSMPEEDRRKAMDLAIEEFQAFRPRMEEAMVTAAASIFTEAELNAAATYYETPEGRSMARKTSQFQNAFLQLYQPIMNDYMAAIAKRAAEME